MGTVVYFSMFSQFNVQNIVKKKTGSVNLPVTLQLLALISKLLKLLLMRHTVTKKKSSRKFYICKLQNFSDQIFTFMHDYVFLLATFDFDYNSIQSFHSITNSSGKQIHLIQSLDQPPPHPLTPSLLTPPPKKKEFLPKNVLYLPEKNFFLKLKEKISYTSLKFL